MTTFPPPQGDGATVDGEVVLLALVEDLLMSLAGVLHDRAMQSLAVARMLLETAMMSQHDDDVLDRGLKAVATAGEQAREVMWALGGVSVRPDHVAQDISDAVARLAPPDDQVDVTVQVNDVDHQMIAMVVQAVHALLVDVLISGGHVTRVSLVSDAEGLQATVTSDHGSPDPGASPWLRLARARLAAVGGDLLLRREGTVQITDLSLPPLGPDRGGVS